MRVWTGLRRRRAPSVRLKASVMLAFITLAPMVLATERTCAEISVTVEGPLPAGWGGALEELCAAMPGWDGIDPTARVRVSSKGTGVEVEVTLGDGRVARRHVPKPNVLRLTVEALVRLPLPLEAPPSSAPPPTAAPVSQPPLTASALPLPSVTAGASWLESAISITGRISGPPAYYALGGVTQLSLHGGAWLLGIEAGWDVVQVLPSTNLPGFEMDSVSVGVFMGRRSRLAPALLVDAAFTTLLVNETQTYDAGTGELTSTATDIRLGGLLRAHLGGHGIRPMITLATEVSPARLRRAVRVGEAFPRLPATTVSIGLGLAFGEP